MGSSFSLGTLFKVYHYTNSAGVDSVCFIPRFSYDLMILSGRGQIPRFLFCVVLQPILLRNTSLLRVFGGRKNTMTVNDIESKTTVAYEFFPEQID